jgi:two-component system sensor histidine kinase HydH
MGPHGWLTLVTCAAELAFAFIALVRGSKSPLTPPLTLLCILLFAWNFFSLAFEVSGVLTWRWLDISASPLTTPLVLHLVLVFVGRRREFRWVLMAAYGGFSLLSITSLLAIAGPWTRGFAGSPTWALVHLVGVVATMGFALNLVRQHLRRANPAEQERTLLLLMAGLVLTAFGSTELWADLGVNVPRLGNLGTLAFSGLVAIVAFRLKLFDRRMSQGLLVYALIIATVGTLAYLAVFRFLGTSLAMLLLGTATVTFALLAMTRQVLSGLAIRRERLHELATLGRFSAQMAHDLKNPLAALKGAVQFLREEGRLQGQGRSKPAAASDEFLELMGEQLARLERVVDRYQRLGRVEPVASSVDLNELVRSVLALQPLAAHNNVVVSSTLADGLPRCKVDRDLLAGALENLVQNAFEAMPDGGTVTVRTSIDPDTVVLSVEDNGQGMDARTRERAFDPFFTTKPTGSGLGLAFVRRVAEAHGGDVTLASKEGTGTTLQLRLPLE